MRNMIYSQGRVLILSTGPSGPSRRQKYKREGEVELCVSRKKSELKNCNSEPQRNIMNQSGIKLLERTKNKDSTRDIL